MLGALPDFVLGIQGSIRAALRAGKLGTAGQPLAGGGGGPAAGGGPPADFGAAEPAVETDYHWDLSGSPTGGGAPGGAQPDPTYGDRARHGVRNHQVPGYVIPPDPQYRLPADDLLYKKLAPRPLSVPDCNYCIPGFDKLKPEERHTVQKLYYSIARLSAVLKANGRDYVLPPAVTRELTASFVHFQERITYYQQIALSDAGYRSLSRQYFQATSKSLLEEDTASAIPGRFGRIHKLQVDELRKQTAKQVAIAEAARQKLRDAKRDREPKK